MNNNSNDNKYDLVPTPRFWKNFIEKGRLKIEQWKISFSRLLHAADRLFSQSTIYSSFRSKKETLNPVHECPAGHRGLY